MLHAIEVVAIFVIFDYFGPNLVAMAMSLRPLQSEMSSLDWIDHKNPLLWVIAFSLSLIEMHLHAFIAILVPKLVAVVMPLCLLCKGVSQINSLMAQTLSQNKALHGCVAYNWSYGYFSDFCLFWPTLVVMATSLRLLQSEISSLDWSTRKTPC